MSDISIDAQNAAFVAARDKGVTDTASKTSASAAQVQLSGDINFFLKMLTTQLKNQDPTQPLDTNQFTQQIAQYSGVQQQVVTNANLEKLLAAQKQSSITTAVSYMGREIETDGNTGEVVGGQGAFSYVLEREAATVEITIKDAAGSVVFKGQGNNDAGRNLVVWDGVNYANGQREPDGVYTIAVVATDAAGKSVKAATRAVAIVGGVESDSTGMAKLSTIRNVKVDLADILAVREPSRAVVGG